MFREQGLTLGAWQLDLEVSGSNGLNLGGDFSMEDLEVRVQSDLGWPYMPD